MTMFSITVYSDLNVDQVYTAMRSRKVDSLNDIGTVLIHLTRINDQGSIEESKYMLGNEDEQMDLTDKDDIETALYLHDRIPTFGYSVEHTNDQCDNIGMRFTVSKDSDIIAPLSLNNLPVAPKHAIFEIEDVGRAEVFLEYSEQTFYVGVIGNKFYVLDLEAHKEFIFNDENSSSCWVTYNNFEDIVPNIVA